MAYTPLPAIRANGSVPSLSRVRDIKTSLHLPVNIMDYGAEIAFDSNGPDSTDAILAAMEDSLEVYVPDTGAGYFRTTSNLPLRSFQKVHGPGKIYNESSGAIPTTYTFTAGWLHPADWTNQTIYGIDPISGGDRTVTLVTAGDAANFSVGDLVVVALVYKDGTNAGINRPANFVEIHRIVEINGADIEIDRSIDADVDFPTATSGTWDVGTTYAAGNTVDYDGKRYVSLVGSNTGNTPPAGSSDSFWSQEYLGISLFNEGETLGKTPELVEQVCLDGLTLRSENGQWLARCGVLEGRFVNLRIEKSSMLVTGNGLSHCLFEDVTGYFTNEFCESAEATYGTHLNRVRGKYFGSGTLATYPINLTRPVKMTNCECDLGDAVTTHIFRLGTYYPGYIGRPLSIRGLKVQGRATANVMYVVGYGHFEFIDNEVNNKNQACNRCIYGLDSYNLNEAVIKDNLFLKLDNSVRTMQCFGKNAKITNNLFQDEGFCNFRVDNLVHSIFEDNWTALASGFFFQNPQTSTRFNRNYYIEAVNP